MGTSKINPSLQLIWISLAINLLFCCTILPLTLQSGSFFSVSQLLETLLWQGLGLIAWPITLIMAFVSPLFSGNLPQLSDLLILFLYPLIEISLVMVLVLKNKKWIPLISAHIMVLISFTITWMAVFTGYNFMVG